MRQRVAEWVPVVNTDRIDAFHKKERKRLKEYRAKNGDHVRAREKKWRDENRDHINENKRKRYAVLKQNPEWLNRKRLRQKLRARERRSKQTCYNEQTPQGVTND